MESIKESTIANFNQYVKSLKKDKANDYRMTLTSFDNISMRNFTSLPLEDVPLLNDQTYKPMGGTALYDAVCKTIREVNDEGAKVITIILTDGEENASHEYDQTHMKILIEEKTKKGNWTFVYLGANQDSYAVAQKFSIPQFNIANFTASSSGIGMTMRTMATNTVAMANSSGTSSANFFSKEDQDNLQGTN